MQGLSARPLLLLQIAFWRAAIFLAEVAIQQRPTLQRAVSLAPFVVGGGIAFVFGRWFAELLRALLS